MAAAIVSKECIVKVRDLQHEVLPRATPEELSRQRAVVSLRKLLNARMRSGNVARFASEGAPAFAARRGRQPQSPEDIRAALFESQRYRMWSAANRSAQEMLWVSVGEPVYRDLDRMSAAARNLAESPGRKGSLTLDPGYDPSPEVADVDIHLQPGGYGMDRGPDDVVAGALYETGGNVFSFGQGAGRSDSKTGVAVRLLAEHFPDFTPRRILDLGCSAGAASAAYAATFADAEVHAIDECNQMGLSPDGDLVETVCQGCLAKLRRAMATYVGDKRKMSSRCGTQPVCSTCGRPTRYLRSVFAVRPIGLA